MTRESRRVVTRRDWSTTLADFERRHGHWPTANQVAHDLEIGADTAYKALRAAELRGEVRRVGKTVRRRIEWSTVEHGT